MRAAVYRSFGPPSVIRTETVPVPERKLGQVLIQVAATSVNPIDWKIRKGDLPLAAYLFKFPRIPGGDVAGIVSDCDRGSKFKKGDKVFGVAGVSQNGATAEYVTMAEGSLAALPPNLTFEQAAAVPLAALTAWQALEKSMPLSGKDVLVHAGAGGVGSFAVQIAKAQGARVTTTCSTRNVEFVTKTLGAYRAVDYTKESFEVVAQANGVQYDHVVDLIGGDYETRSFKCLKRGGHYANVINNGWFDKYSFKLLGVAAFTYSVLAGVASSYLGGPGYSLVAMQASATRGLEQVAVLLAAGSVVPVVDRVVPLEEAAAAHEFMETQHARGKVVIKVADL